MGLGRLFKPKEPDIPTPAVPAPDVSGSTLQNTVDTQNDNIRKRRAKGKRDLAIPTVSTNTGTARGQGVNI